VRRPPTRGVRPLAGCHRPCGVVIHVSVTTLTPDAPAALFPGQGSHTPDMRDLVAERAGELLQRCVALVGEDPFPRVEESTRFAQPAIFCASMAGWDALGAEPCAAAGHSLGELAALAAAGVLRRDDALRLVVLRGKLMGEARNGSMLALVGATFEDAEAIAAEAGVTVANDNAPGQVVLSGPREALEQAQAAAAGRGRRSIALDVAGAFHSPAMAPSVTPFRAALEEVELGEPRFPVFSCASAAPFTDVREELAGALTKPVRWRETILALHEAGAREWVEAGPGAVLTKMNKRILKDAPAHA
jgi:[acyl-carrier-protein] S-malonyltransferase